MNHLCNINFLHRFGWRTVLFTTENCMHPENQLHGAYVENIWTPAFDCQIYSVTVLFPFKYYESQNEWKCAKFGIKLKMSKWNEQINSITHFNKHFHEWKRLSLERHIIDCIQLHCCWNVRRFISKHKSVNISKSESKTKTSTFHSHAWTFLTLCVQLI